jgi:hypothetical protein
LLTDAIWLLAILLECSLVLRGIVGGWAKHFRVFYFYISFIFFQEMLRIGANHVGPAVYMYTYWITEFIGVVLGCGIVFEIYKAGLELYPGTARMVRNILAFVFVLAFTKAFVDASNDPRWLPAASTMELERNVRIVQLLALAALVALFSYYRVPFGRNLRGMVLGYGLYVTASIPQLTFAASEGGRFLAFWRYLAPVSYDVALLLLVVHLWSYEPQPTPARTVLLEQDYQRVAAATQRRLREARGFVGRVMGL